MRIATPNDVIMQIQMHDTKSGHVRAPTLLLGAGLSSSAGIPLARPLAESIARETLKNLSGGKSPESLQATLTQLNQRVEAFSATTSDLYPRILQHFYPSPTQQQNIIRQCIGDHHNKLNAAHLAIALLAHHNLVGHLLTTNFDDLLHRSLILARAQANIYDTAQLGTIDTSTARALIHLHGRINGSYRLLSTAQDIQQSSPHLQSTIQSIALQSRALIISGYAGEEGALMNNLIRAYAAARDSLIVLVSYEGPDTAISRPMQELAETSRNFWLIPNQDADTFWLGVVEQLASHINPTDLPQLWSGCKGLGLSIGISERAQRTRAKVYRATSPTESDSQRLLAQAKQLEVQGRLEQAASTAERAADLSADYRFSVFAAHLAFEAGYKFNLLDLIDKSDALLERAQALAEEELATSDDTTHRHVRRHILYERAKCQSHYAKQKRDSDMLKSALAIARESADLCDPTYEASDLAAIAQRVAAIACDVADATKIKSDAHQAITEAKHSVSLATGQRDIQLARSLENLGHAYHILASIYMESGDLTKSLECANSATAPLNQTLAIARDRGDVMLQAHAALNLGGVYTTKFVLESNTATHLMEAIRQLRTSYELRTAASSVWEAGLSGCALAQCLILLADTENNTHHLTEATTVLSKTSAALDATITTRMHANVTFLHAYAWAVGARVDQRSDLLDSIVKPQLARAEDLARDLGDVDLTRRISELKERFL